MDLLFSVINVHFCVPFCEDLLPWRTAGFSSIMDASMKNMTSLPWRSKKDKWCLNIPQVWNVLLLSNIYVNDLNLVHYVWLSALLGTGESSTQVTPFLPGGVSDGNWHTVHIHYYNKVGFSITLSVFSITYIPSFGSPFGPCFDIMKQTAVGFIHPFILKLGSYCDGLRNTSVSFHRIGL